jgi:hypothetical protein
VAHFRALRQQVRVHTPDPYVDAAVGALNVAADALWDEPQQAIMHGAIAWRTALLGWRGGYAMDALGWHDRARAHYAAIWASDNLEYSGGGVTHASAYNFWHNAMAARVRSCWKRTLHPTNGKPRRSSGPWRNGSGCPAQGMFAEYRDWLGLQRAHPSAALWSFYHVLDAAGLVGARQAWQMTRYVDRALPHLPVGGHFLVKGGLAESGIDLPGAHVLATSNWAPYTWSINNVGPTRSAGRSPFIRVGR